MAEQSYHPSNHLHTPPTPNYPAPIPDQQLQQRQQQQAETAVEAQAYKRIFYFMTRTENGRGEEAGHVTREICPGTTVSMFLQKLEKTHGRRFIMKEVTIHEPTVKKLIVLLTSKKINITERLVDPKEDLYLISQKVEQVNTQTTDHKIRLELLEIPSRNLKEEMILRIDTAFSVGFPPEYQPPKTCHQAILDSKEFLVALIPDLEQILNQCEQLCEKVLGSLQVAKLIKEKTLTRDEVYSLVLYTYDIGPNNKTNENFFYQLNEILRKRSKEGMNAILGYMWFATNALRKLPNFKGNVYRGNNQPDVVEREYAKGRAIFWSGFTSTTTDLNVAKQFAGKNGVIFRLDIASGKVISPFSCITRENEVLLPPNAGLFVSQPIHIENDGFKYVDLVEKSDTFRW